MAANLYDPFSQTPRTELPLAKPVLNSDRKIWLKQYTILPRTNCWIVTFHRPGKYKLAAINELEIKKNNRHFVATDFCNNTQHRHNKLKIISTIMKSIVTCICERNDVLCGRKVTDTKIFVSNKQLMHHLLIFTIASQARCIRKFEFAYWNYYIVHYKIGVEWTPF